VVPQTIEREPAIGGSLEHVPPLRHRKRHAAKLVAGLDHDLIGEVRCSEKEAAFFARHIKTSPSQVAADTAAAEQILIQDEIRYGRIGHVPGRLSCLKQIEYSTGGFHRVHKGREVTLTVPLSKG